MKYLSFACCLGFFCFSLIGCSSGPKLPSDLPDLTPCILTITQDGQALAGATVSLTPEPATSWLPGGITNEKGEVELFTNGQYAGVPAGKYKITIRKVETEPSKLGPAPQEDDPNYVEWMEKSSQERRDSYTLVEKKYTNIRTTPLEIEIPGGTTTFDVGKAVRDRM